MQIANRKKEVEKFEQLLSDHQQRILFLKAPSSYGKSHLIDRFTHLCQNQSRVKLVNLDLTDSVTGIAYFISRMKRKLQTERFLKYREEVRQILSTQRNASMSNIDIQGDENTLQILLNTDEQQKQLRLAQLEDAFFQDLGQIQSTVVMMIDAFEKAPEELKKWIGTAFLPATVEHPNLRVVIAGQEVPEASSEWRACHHCCELTPITEVDVWCEYAKAQRWKVTKDMIIALVHHCKGHPRDVVESIISLEASINPNGMCS